MTRKWYTGQTTNHGIAIAANPDTAEPVGYSSSNYTSVTTDRPKMVIDYVIDPEGINDFWTYTGEGVMPFKGNLFLSATDIATSGLGIDAVVTRSYNSRQTVASGVFGSGWLSSLDMKVWDMEGSIAFLDASGTRHIFNWNNDRGQYEPPAGITLSIIKDETNGLYKITTTDNTNIYFDINSSELTKIVDSDSNETTFTTAFFTGDLLITDPTDRVTRIHFDNSKVDKITDPKGREVKYTYNTSGLLEDVNISDGTESITYSYTYAIFNDTLLLKQLPTQKTIP